MARVSIPVTDKEFDRMSKLFPWGTRTAIVRRIMILLCDQIEREGYGVVQLLIDGRYNPLEGYKDRGKLT